MHPDPEPPEPATIACPRCGYSRQGIAPDRPCPECGLEGEILVTAPAWLTYQPTRWTLVTSIAGTAFATWRLMAAISGGRPIGRIIWALLAIFAALIVIAELRSVWLARQGRGEIRLGVTPEGIVLFGDVEKRCAWDEIVPESVKPAPRGFELTIKSVRPPDLASRVLVECDEATAGKMMALMEAQRPEATCAE